MFISLPEDWQYCPEWWKILVTKIEREANHQGIFVSTSPTWTNFLDEKLKEEGIIFKRSMGVTFESEEDFLVFRLKHGI